MRTIVESSNLATQFAQWKIDYARWDDAFIGAGAALRAIPETFPQVPGTDLRRIKLVPFAGVPNLSIFFRYDDEKVTLEFAEIFEEDE